jgi:gas vesicle protein
MASSLLGAAIGAVVGYIYFTDEGRAWREQMEGNLDSLAREAEKLFGAVDQVRTGISELKSGAGSWQQRSA